MSENIKLYPPSIEGTIPAFYGDAEGNAKLVVPFSMNRAVSKTLSGLGMALKLKTVQNNIFLIQMTTSDIDFDNCIATFNINQPSTLKIGQYYKI
jgi:hypothetical protein